MRRSRFKVVGRNFDGQQEATVEIERTPSGGLVHVRPKYCKRTYTLPLDWVAATVIWHVVKSEVAESGRRTRRRR